MAEPTRRRAAARPSPSAIVKTSVPLDVETHARLCAAAALQQRDRSALAAEILTDALRGMCTIIDKRKTADPASSDCGEDRVTAA
jgi:hypothetical protein